MKRKLYFIIFITFIICASYIQHSHSFISKAHETNTAFQVLEAYNQRLSTILNDFLTIIQSHLSLTEQREQAGTDNQFSDLNAIYVKYQDGFTYESVPESIQSLMYGNSYKADCSIPWSDLNYLKVKYYNFDQEVNVGEIICNKAIAQDLVEIFYELYCNQYQIEEICLVDHYQADDELSMEHNNTSCFNYRTVSGSATMSKHSLGLAIDINPFYNPYVKKSSNGSTSIAPFGSEAYVDRTVDFPHKITPDDLCYQLFTAHGFTWGGSWKNSKDYQHFQKEI